MRSLYRNIFDNPILTRELRRRMRGKALVYSIIGYIILMTVTSILVLLAGFDPSWVSDNNTQVKIERLTATGRRLFQFITIIQCLLVLIIAPTITAGMTTGEKEKKTFDFLRVTTISPWMYITGCFLSTVFYVGLALLCALPLISLTFLYGGVGRQDVIGMTALLLGISMVLSAFGLYISSVRERTRTAQGIVVFMIFAVLFGGIVLLSRISAWLGTGLTSGGGTVSGFSVYGFPLPQWALVGGGILLLTAIFLLLSARKLFEPDEARAFSHWQFALLAFVVLAASLGILAGRPLSDPAALSFLSLGFLLLISAVLCFAVGRMEVGDEIWHLKRLLPFLRPFDQTIPFLVAVGFGWYYAGHLFRQVPVNLGPVQPAMIDSAIAVSLAGYAFFCAFGRFMTAQAASRRSAGHVTFALIVGLWFVVPILVLLGLRTLVGPAGFLSGVFHLVGRFSPFYIIIEGTNEPSRYPAADSLMHLNGFHAVLIYMALAIILIALGEWLRFRRWRGFDYHFDMPSR